jgi:hypothetical protein
MWVELVKLPNNFAKVEWTASQTAEANKQKNERKLNETAKNGDRCLIVNIKIIHIILSIHAHYFLFANKR